MAKLILKYEAAVLKEVTLKQAALSIGRTADNDVVIDNLAVSGHHAKLLFETDRFVLEDLNSLNGTFVNNQRIRRTSLKNGDEVLIGKHTLIFQDEGAVTPPPPMAADATVPIAKMEETMVLDTKKRREFIQKATTVAEGGVSAATVERIGTLVVLAGKTDQKEYLLTSKLAMIGKSEMASVKLKGWFAPDVAAVINKREGKYQLSPSGKQGAKVNGQDVAASTDLKEGDMIEVAGVKLQFNYRE